MAELWQPHVVGLARELKSLVGRGITGSKTATALPNLKRVLGVPGDARQTVIQRRLRQRLGEEIRKIEGLYAVFDPPREISADRLQSAYECLFHLVTPADLKNERFAGLKQYERRRLYAINALDAPYPLRSWRLPDGPELQLMLFLAKRLTEAADTDEGFITESAEMHVNVDEWGVTKHVTVIGSMRATRNGVDHGDFYLHYKPDPRPDVYQIEFIDGITRSEESWNETTGTKVVTAYFDSLNVDETLIYIYRLTLNTQIGVRSSVYHAPASDYSHCKTLVTFAESRMPREVWWFERLHPFDIPGKPSPPTLLQLRNGNVYIKEWSNAPAGYCCGLGWNWQDT